MKPTALFLLVASMVWTATPACSQGIRVGPDDQVVESTLSLPFMFYNENLDFALGYVYGVGGKTKSYHSTTSGSFGLQAGAQSTAVFLLFMTDEALARFQASSGWTVGADASVTLLSVGASAQVTTATAQQPVIGYVLSNRGLMAGITLDGTRITRLDL